MVFMGNGSTSKVVVIGAINLGLVNGVEIELRKWGTLKTWSRICYPWEHLMQQGKLARLKKDLLQVVGVYKSHEKCKVRWLVHGAWISKEHDEGRDSSYKEDSINSLTNHRRFLGNV